MDTGQFDKVVENVYSLKHKRTLVYKIESEVTQKEPIRACNSIGKRKIQLRTLSFTDRLESVESFKVNSGKEKRLISLFSAKLLPSQFLVTPVKVLNKLTDRVYNFSKRPKEVEEEEEEKNEFESNTLMVLKRRTDKPKNSGNKGDSQTVLKRSYKKILKDDKRSRKVLNAASEILGKRLALNELLARKPSASEFQGFEKRLKEAHNYLLTLEKIPSLNSQSKRVGKNN